MLLNSILSRYVIPNGLIALDFVAIFDRSGRYVITGSDDRLVKVWSMETALCLASCRGHEVSSDLLDLKCVICWI